MSAPVTSESNGESFLSGEILVWQTNCEVLNEGQALRFTLLSDGDCVSISSVLDLWQDNASFRSYFTSLLVNNSFSAYRWETPPISNANADRPFEFVLLRSEALDRPVDRTAFEEHFNQDSIVTFSNLGGDAVMVVPCPIGQQPKYGHLASFLRHAPETQIHKLWQSISAAMHQRLAADQVVWLSTAGMGVAWLHVRLDSRPKYYGYTPYKAG